MMTRIIFFLFFFTLCTSVSAQIGITGAVATIKADDWHIAFQQEYDTSDRLFFFGDEIGLNYWFRLKKKRIEFYPTITHGSYKFYYEGNDPSIFSEEEEEVVVLKTTFSGFHFDTRIYIFDFGGDCDCPVWSKQNDVLKKGFYLMLSPGFDFVQTSLKDDITRDLLPTVSGGIGLDLGISNFLTVTPFATVRYTPEVDGNTFFPNTSTGNDFQDALRLIGGFSINLRFDGKKY